MRAPALVGSATLGCLLPLTALNDALRLMRGDRFVGGVAVNCGRRAVVNVVIRDCAPSV